MKWRGYCNAYTNEDQDSKPVKGFKAPSKSAGRLIHTKKAPILIADPDVNTIRFENSEQKAYFDEWAVLSVTYLSGGLAHTRLWTTTMPQVTLEEPTLRYGAMAVGALRRAYIDAGQDIGTALTTSNKHYLNAIIYYCEAMRQQGVAKPSRDSLRTALLSSLLFICFETQRANMPTALKHIIHGFGMLNELAACTAKAPDLVSIAQAPPTLVEEILDCYRPLELQSRSFIGSYQKFFFPPKPQGLGQASAMSPPPTGGLELGDSSPRSRGPSPGGQAGSPQQNQSPTPSSQGSQTGLPSPMSQGSPQVGVAQSMSPMGQQQQPPLLGSPQGLPQGAPRPLQRPPGIMPFTRHSPYFRPKKSHITSLDDMPLVFPTFEEAQGYWTLLQKWMVQYIPILTMVTSQLSLTKTTDLAELDRKFTSVRQNPKISKFVAESRYWLQRWIEAFDPIFNAAVRDKHNDLQPYMQAAHLRIEYLVLNIYTAIPRYSGLITARGLTPQYREINVLAESLLRARPICGFAMDSGWTWPLFVSAFSCRDPGVRAESIRILGQYPIRNALRDSRVFRAIALRNQETEMANAAYGDDEQSQWMRLRRREVVFEDFGTNVIYRSPQLDPVTGRWELVEEAADFVVQRDGTLNWQRQPLSESSSILSGVC
jgi:hypothetical protein